MFEVLVDLVSPLFVVIVGGAILAILIYIGKSLGNVVDLIELLSDKQEKTDRILFGEDNFSEGLIQMIYDNRREIERLRLIQMEFINKLRKEDIIDYDDDIKDLCYKLNKELSN